MNNCYILSTTSHCHKIKKQDKCSKLKTFSIVPMLSEVINRLNKAGSLSQIFEI
jgi:phosphoribosylpyrophosphate synthetase